MRTLFAALMMMACRPEQQLISDDYPPVLPNPPEEPENVVLDRTVQVVQPVVDILFVVDNSSSMGNEQVALRTNFPRFIDHFVNAGIDYHIAMVSTDMFRPGHNGLMRQGNGYNYIDGDTEDPAAVFQAMTNSLGVHIASIESGRAAAYTALETLAEHPRNTGFLREDADLHLIFVSDDEDQSGGNPITKNEFIAWVDNLKEGDFTAYMHGIVTPDPACNGNIVSAAYLEYAAVTGGITHSICATDWAPALDELGLLAAGLKQEFFLTRIPTFFPELLLEVEVHTVDENGDTIIQEFVECIAGEEVEDPTCEVVYVPGRNSIVFLEYVPTDLAEVFVEYPVGQ